VDNPFVGIPDVLGEFWTIGLRNPYRLSFDGGDLWGGDVGQDRHEYVFVAGKGSNFGWSFREGIAPFAESPLKGVAPSPVRGTPATPMFDYAHANGNGCIIGGHVYRGDRLTDLRGTYVFGDFNSGRIFSLALGSVPKLDTLLRLPADRKITGFGRDREGELLLCVSGARSSVLRLTRRDR
jgi:glucose/arabinose dehydrogenase